MRRIILFVALLTLACLISTLSEAAVYAAEARELTLTVRQTFVREGASAPPSEVFMYRLTRQTAAAPMPAGSDATSYTCTIAGTREREVGPITFTTAGVFIYELRSVTADQSGYTIDRRVYTIEVHVTESLEVVVIYHSGDVKVPELLFEHSYRDLSPSPTPTPSPTPSPQPPPSPTPTPTPPPPLTPTPTPFPTPVPSTPTPNPPPPPARPSPTPTPEGPKGADAPKTGDDSNPALWATLIVTSSVLLLFVLWIAWRSREGRRRA